MPELMINPTPAKAPSGTGTASALNQSDATNRAGESAKADNATESTFAATLKSQMDKKAAAADEGKAAASVAVADGTEAENPIAGADLSVLLPLLGANSVGTESMPTVPVASRELATGPDEKTLPELHTAAEQVPGQILATASTGPVTAFNMPSGKHDVEARNEAFATGIAVKSDATSPVPGKTTPDAAITADVAPSAVESNSSEHPGGDFRALLERAAAMTPAATIQTSSATASPNLRMDTPLGQSGWHDEMGQKLTWMVGNKSQQADIVLTPPQLGRVEISLTMNGDQATAIFTSPNAAVREVLENSLHRLREILADAGVSLGQAQVGSESPNQSSRKNEPDFGTNEGVRYASTIPLQGVESAARGHTGRSMIDIFA